VDSASHLYRRLTTATRYLTTDGYMRISVPVRPCSLATATSTSPTHVRALQTSVADGKVTIEALPGALVGPPWSKRMNAWLLTAPVSCDSQQTFKIYAEPHASHDVATLKSISPVDVAIFPTASSYVAGACWLTILLHCL
jgi:hypothetical protein